MKSSKLVFLAVLLNSCLFVQSQSVAPAAIEISFYGNENLSNDELVADFKSCGDQTWQEYDERAYDYFARKCSRSLMLSKGFWKANVIDITSSVRAGVRAVQVVVDEGPRYRMGKASIEGNEAISTKDILETLNQRPGDVADGKALQYLLYEKLKVRYDELGYALYNAEFEPTFIESKDGTSDGVVNVLITIDEGPQFKVRRIRFDGVEPDESESLSRSFPLGPGNIYVSRKLAKGVESINQTRKFEWIDKDQHVQILVDEESATVDLVISLKKVQRDLIAAQ